MKQGKTSTSQNDGIEVIMSLRTIRTEDVELATEAFGDATDSPILLRMGGMASMLWWPEEFCRRLAARGRFVIRYDQRDSGLSTKYPPGRPGYDFDDAVDDVFRVLDGYRITAAHFVGFSQGGMVGQGAALNHSERVLTLTAISTTPIGVDKSGLPGSGKAWLEHMAMDVDWSHRAEAVAYLVEDARLVAGTAYKFDEAGTKAFIERDFDRSGGYASGNNHSVLFDIGDAWCGRLGGLRPPLLVIHGTADPIFPMEHGEALAAAVPGASLVALEGGGHELHPAHWDAIIAAITRHTA
jgi:pimeloyl-ACP methyl ester carboxylesterase